MVKIISLKLILAALAVGLAESAQGTAQLSRVRRVVNGDKASIKDFPFYVKINFSHPYQFCGGSIISNTWVLTAAHCTISRSPKHAIVQVGSDDVNPGRDYAVGRIIEHPRYDRSHYVFDYALLRSKEPIQFNSRVSAIKLGRSGDVRKGTVGTLVGRGFSHMDYAMAGNPLDWHYPLLKAQLTITDMETCEQGKRDENSTLPEILIPSYRKYTICSQSERSLSQSGCQGDSGGPFVVSGRLAGVVSEVFHPKGCRVRHSGLIVNSFASVPAAARWILREIAGNTDFEPHSHIHCCKNCFNRC